MIQQLMLQPGLYHFGSLNKITVSYNQSVCEFFGRTTTTFDQLSLLVPPLISLPVLFVVLVCMFYIPTKKNHLNYINSTV